MFTYSNYGHAKVPVQQFGSEYISAARCIRGKRIMAKLEKVAISHNFNFRGRWCFLYQCKNDLLKTLTKVIMFVE